jgi:hypothetical protein
MDAIQRLVEQDDEGFEDKFSDENGQDQPLISLGSPVLKLVGVRAASAGYAISTPLRDGALDILDTMGRDINDPANANWSASTISSLKDISEIAKTLGVKVEIRKPNKGSRLGDVIARITPKTYEEVANSAFVHGQTSLYGTVERIGGSSAARCAFWLPGESKLIYCSVKSEELAKKLGSFLYQDISIHGSAKWLRANWRVCSFKIVSFEPPKAGSFKEALSAIWEAGGKVWDNIEDPNEYLNDIRGA